MPCHVGLFAVPDQGALAHSLEDDRWQAVRLLVLLEHLDACSLILDLLLLALVARPDPRVEEGLANRTIRSAVSMRAPRSLIAQTIRSGASVLFIKSLIGPVRVASQRRTA